MPLQYLFFHHLQTAHFNNPPIQRTPPVFISTGCRLIGVTGFTCFTALSFFQKPNTIASRWIISPESLEIGIGFGANRPSFLVQASPPVCCVTGLAQSRLEYQRHADDEQKPHPVCASFHFVPLRGN